MIDDLQTVYNHYVVPVDPERSILLYYVHIQTEESSLGETLTAAKKDDLSKKQDSLLGLQRLLIATCETQQEMAGIKECFGESWFRPQWERFVLVPEVRGMYIVSCISNNAV